MTRLIVDVAFGYTVTSASPVWTPITRFVDCIESGVRGDRGASDEISETQPGTYTLTLTNADGRFTPERTGPYSPNIKKNVPLRIAVATLTPQSGSAPYPIEQLGDDFDDDQVNTTIWSGNFNGAVEAGGYARVPAAAGVTAGYASARQYTLTGSKTTVRLVTVPSPTGATSATCTFMVNAVTSGTRIGFVVNSVTNQLQLKSDVSFSDAGQVNLTHSKTDHAWLRIREASGTVYWETSPNGSDWTVRRSAATPAWVGTDQVLVQLAATRDAGATDYAEYDLIGATVHPRFAGMVNEWPVKWNGLHSKVTITATDMFKRLARAPGAAASTLRAMLVEEVLLDKPYAYYPMSEPEGSTTCGDLASRGAQATTVNQAGSGGTLSFGTGTGPDDTLGCVVFTPVNDTNGKYFHADLGTAMEAASNTDFVKVECWFKTSTKDRVLLVLRSINLALQMIFTTDPVTGDLIIKNRGETEVDSSYATGDIADGKVHHLLYDEADKRVYIDGVDKGTNPAVASTFDVRLLRIGGYANAGCWNGEIAHVAVYANSSLTAASVLEHNTCGTTGFSGEAGNTRIARLASYVGITNVISQGASFSAVGSQRELGKSALDHMRDVEKSESGKLLSNRAAPGLLFQSRGVRYNPTTAFSLVYHQLETDEGEMKDDDQKIVNIVVASRSGGATQRVIDQASIDTYGPYELPLELIKTNDNEVIDAANWTISRYKDPPPELREVVVDGFSLPVATYRALLDADVSTVFSVTSLPAEAPASSQTVTIEGYSETIREGSHLFAFHVSRTNTDAVWVLDSSTYSVLGTTTRLAY